MSKSSKGKFTADEWKTIRAQLKAKPQRYGLPQRVYGSVVLGSFNIRKLGGMSGGGTHRRDAAHWEFLADVCKHFDLLGVQEVMPDTEGILHLRKLMGEDDYGLIYSDSTGAFPGKAGLAERMAFLYNRNVVRREELVTDLTYDRTEVIKRIADSNDEIHDKLKDFAAKRKAYREKLDQFLAGKGGSKPPKEPPMGGVKMPAFVAFARTPFAVDFQVRGYPGTDSYRFLGVNAHLLFGDSTKDRQREGEALIRWIMSKIVENAGEKLSVVLFGDLNLDFDKPDKDFQRIHKAVSDINKELGSKEVVMSFPFMFPHPNLPQGSVEKSGQVIRTNVLLNQTYDQIGVVSTDDRLKKRLETTATAGTKKTVWGLAPEGPDYGVFNFSQLFSEALNGKKIEQLDRKKGGERAQFVNRYEFRVSDHMPIWMRVPLPRLESGVDIP